MQPLSPSEPPHLSRRWAGPSVEQSIATSTTHDRGAKRVGAPLVSERDDAILQALYRYQFLTVDQVVTLFYAPASVEYVRVRLKRLYTAGYVTRLRLPRAAAGNAPWVYTLARQGITYLKAAGFSEFVTFELDSQQHSWLFLNHTLSVNDFLIAAELLHQQVPEVVLADMRHERVLRRHPVPISLSQGETMTLVPDGWLDFHLRQTARMCVLLELDMGTIEQKAFKRKLRGLLAFLTGPTYQELFGTPSVTVAIATTAGDSRAARIRSWIEQVLRAQQQEQEAEFFLVASLPQGTLDAQHVFLTPCWQQPFGQAPLSLLTL